jgi:hypothetical protein
VNHVLRFDRVVLAPAKRCSFDPQVKQRVFHGGETLAKLLMKNGLLKPAGSAHREILHGLPRGNAAAFQGKNQRKDSMGHFR